MKGLFLQLDPHTQLAQLPRARVAQIRKAVLRRPKDLQRAVEAGARHSSDDAAGSSIGIRIPPRGLLLFEAILNAVHKAAPGAAIAFNTRPEDSAEAAARWLSPTN